MPVSVTESYRICGQMVRRASTNFFLSFWLLPVSKRRAMSALYAFARYTDDLADSDQATAEQAELLTDWRSLVAKQFGEVEVSDDNNSRSHTDHTAGQAILPALVDSVSRFKIPHRYLLEIIDGVLSDTTHTGYATFAELDRYCYQVASAVGLACLHIWGFTDDAAHEPAKQCGTAFQLTNILRDLKEDRDRGRIYLPTEDLERFDYRAADLRAGLCDERFRNLIRFQVARAEDRYRAAASTVRYLHADGQRMFSAMFNTYRAILHKIGREPELILQRRVRLSLPKKLLIVADSCVRGVRVST